MDKQTPTQFNMTKEFNLSEKEIRTQISCPENKPGCLVFHYKSYFLREDVKEFIRLLKEEMRKELKSKQTPEAQKDEMCSKLLEDLYYKPLDKVIDKLAGKSLI